MNNIIVLIFKIYQYVYYGEKCFYYNYIILLSEFESINEIQSHIYLFGFSLLVMYCRVCFFNENFVENYEFNQDFKVMGY